MCQEVEKTEERKTNPSSSGKIPGFSYPDKFRVFGV
jgi:hypothetical protein